MSEPTFSSAQLAQIEDILLTVPLAPTLLAIARMLGFLTWERDDPDEASLAFAVQELSITQGLVRDIHTPNKQWVLDLIADMAIVKANVAAIKAKTDVHLPVPAYPTPPTTGQNASAVWDHQIGIHIQANAAVTARQLLRASGQQALLNQIFGLQPIKDNADFAIANYIDTRWLPTYSSWSPSGLNPRVRNAGETVLQYLQRVQASAGWYSLGRLAGRDLTSPGGGIVATVVCLVQDAPANPYPVLELGDIPERLAQYLPLPGEGVPTAPVALSTGGTIAAPATASAVCLELAEPPGQYRNLPGELDWYRTLGVVICGNGDAWGLTKALHRRDNWIALDPGTEEVAYMLKPGVFGSLYFLLSA